MPVDFSILQRAPTIGQGILAGQQRARERAIQNRLLARQDLQFQQQQEDRARQLQQTQQQEAIFKQAADMIRQAGLDPDDPQVLQQFTAAAVQSRQPQLISLAGAMSERAAKRKQQQAEADALQAALTGRPMGARAAAPAAAVPAAPAAMTQPPAAPAITATTFDEGAARPEMPRPSIAARTAAVEPPMPMGPARELPPPNALVGPAPAAEPAANRLTAPADPNAERIAELEAKRDRLEMLGTTKGATLAAQTQRQIDKLKGPAATAAEREYQLAKQQGFKGSFIEFKQALRPQTNIKVDLPPQEQQERKARGDLLVEQYKDVSKAASLAARTLPALDVQERVLNAGFETGFGTDAQKAAASVLARLGVPEAKEYATNAQTFLAATQQAVLQRQLEQKGPQTESDAQRITQTGAQLGNTTDANRFIIAVAKAQLKRDIEQRNFYDSWWKKNKTYDGAEDAWFSGAGSKSLFEDPVLKSFAPERGRVGGEAAGGVPPYADPEKERRYQEWKRNQGKP